MYLSEVIRLLFTLTTVRKNATILTSIKILK